MHIGLYKCACVFNIIHQYSLYTSPNNPKIRIILLWAEIQEAGEHKETYTTISQFKRTHHNMCPQQTLINRGLTTGVCR